MLGRVIIVSAYDMNLLNFAYLDKSFFESIDAQSVVGHRSSDAILAKASWLDAQSAQQGQNGRGATSVALEFYHHDIIHRGVFVRQVVVEANVEVDGESFRLVEVDQGDAAELIAYGGTDFAEPKSGLLVEEVRASSLAHHVVERGHLDARLACGAVVVFLLDFEEGEVRVHVGAHSHFLSRLAPRLVLSKHGVRLRRIEISSGIGAHPLSVNLLCIVATAHQSE